MALVFFGSTKCAICGLPVTKNDELVTTSQFVDQEHHLHRYSDAAMHARCFQRWPHRQEFVDLFNDTRAGVIHGNGMSVRMRDDGTFEETLVDPERAQESEVRMLEIAQSREARLTERRRADAEWAGRARDCPACGHTFASVQARGACPSCKTVFDATASD